MSMQLRSAKMSEILCNDCLDTGWIEDREGRSVCSCISETDPYQQLQAEVERLRECDKEYWLVVERTMTLEKERDEARAEVERLKAEYHEALQMAANQAVTIKGQINEIERLRQCCTQRGARMQIMREWMDEPRGLHTPGLWPPTEWYYFTQDRPEAEKWFDDDGVPK